MLFIIKISVILIFLNLYRLCDGIIYQDLEDFTLPFAGNAGTANGRSVTVKTISSTLLKRYLKTVDDSNYEVSIYNKHQDSGIIFARQHQLSLSQSDNEDGNDVEEQFSRIVEQVPKPVSLQQVKDSMDKDTACCMLGQIAGDKGYHCHVKFYSNQIMARNKNRVHNRKMSFYGRDKIPNFGEKLMRRFEKCIDNKSYIFYHCCHMAAMEKDNANSPHYNTFKRRLYNSRINNNVLN